MTTLFKLLPKILIGCNSCHKSIHAECGKVYTCMYCKKEVTTEPRCRFDVQLLNNSGYITANCFGHHAEKLLLFTAADLKDNSDEVASPIEHFLRRTYQQKTHFFLLEAYNLTLSGKTQRKLTIVVIQDGNGESSTSIPT